MLRIILAIMPLLWKGVTSDGTPCRVYRDNRGFLVRRKGQQDRRLKGGSDQRVCEMAEALNETVPADLILLVSDGPLPSTDCASAPTAEGLSVRMLSPCA